MDDLVFGLSTSTVGVDGTNGIFDYTDSSDLRRRGAGLNALKAISEGSLRLRNVNAQSKGNYFCDVGIGAKDTDRNTKALAKEAHGLQTLLVVGTTTTNKNLHIVVDELILVLLEGANDTLESGSDIGKVGNTTTDNEDLAIRARSSTSDKIDY